MADDSLCNMCAKFSILIESAGDRGCSACWSWFFSCRQSQQMQGVKAMLRNVGLAQSGRLQSLLERMRTRGTPLHITYRPTRQQLFFMHRTVSWSSSLPTPGDMQRNSTLHVHAQQGPNKIAPHQVACRSALRPHSLSRHLSSDEEHISVRSTSVVKTAGVHVTNVLTTKSGKGGSAQSASSTLPDQYPSCARDDVLNFSVNLS